jgi:hypothetical protein
MEMQVDDASVVSADGALPAGELDQPAAHLLMTARDGFGNASLAPPLWRAPAAQGEFSNAVAPASTNFNRARTVRRRRAPLPWDEYVMDILAHEHTFAQRMLRVG